MGIGPRGPQYDLGGGKEKTAHRVERRIQRWRSGPQRPPEAARRTSVPKGQRLRVYRGGTRSTYAVCTVRCAVCVWCAIFHQFFFRLFPLSPSSSYVRGSPSPPLLLFVSSKPPPIPPPFLLLPPLHPYVCLLYSHTHYKYKGVVIFFSSLLSRDTP